MFNEICINKEMLPKYTYFKHYIYIYIMFKIYYKSDVTFVLAYDHYYKP